MCGVNGVFAYHPAAGVPDEAELTATRESMRARGPDGSGRLVERGPPLRYGAQTALNYRSV